MTTNTRISPDAYMDRPIENLLFWASRMVRRCMKYASMDPETLESPAVQSVMDTDEQMRVAYLAAIRLRAKEVCEYAAKRGYRCDPILVRENPFGVCMALFPETEDE